jgi:hypothetical protein
VDPDKVGVKRFRIDATRMRKLIESAADLSGRVFGIRHGGPSGDCCLLLSLYQRSLHFSSWCREGAACPLRTADIQVLGPAKYASIIPADSQGSSLN